MPTNYVRKTDRGLTSLEMYELAYEAVRMRGLSLRSAASAYKINYMTLYRFVKKKKASEDNPTQKLSVGYLSQTIFTNEEETTLCKYLLTCPVSNYGITREARKLAYKLAMEHNTNIPNSWHTNKMAGEAWLKLFMKRHPILAIRLPQATSTALGTSLNTTNVGPLGAAVGWNIDETGSAECVAGSAIVKVERTDEEMECEAQLPGSTTPSPLFQDIVLPPITIEPKKEEVFCNPENEERISLILNKKLSFLPEQLPLRIADGEYKVVKEIICNDDVFRNATLLTKVHCTVCDTHLGASAIAQFDRFVHPVLNTLLCESCFVFYNTAEFAKDEDGNENYCRWCAQSGTVICCSDCTLLFCKGCVERNFGERVWRKIVNAVTWQCFNCNPSQLSKLHIMCSAVHEYTLKIIKKAMLTDDKDILRKDISMCCKEDSTTTKKRKHIVLDDEVDLQDIPIALRKRMKMCHDLNESLSTSGFTLADKKSAPSTPIAISLSESPAHRKTQEVIDTLSRQCEYMRQATRIPKNNAQYAELRNNIQHALYQCSSILLETRKVVLMDQIHPSINTNNKKVPARVLPVANKTAVTSVDGAGKHSTIILPNNGTNVFTPLPSGPKVPNQLKRVIWKPPGSRLRPTTTGLNPVLMNKIQPANTMRLVHSNVKNNYIASSQVGSKTIGNIVPSSMEAASKNNMYDKHLIGVKKTKTADKDPLAMSDDEIEGSCIKTEIDIDEPIMIKVEEDES